MVEMFTPELIAIAIAALTVFTLLTFLMAFTAIATLSRVKKRLTGVREQLLELEESRALPRENNHKINTHIVRLDEATEKIAAFEPRLNDLENQVPALAGGAGKIAALESRLNDLENQVPALAGGSEKIPALERGLTKADERIAESQKQLAGHASKLNDHAKLLGQAGQMIGQGTASLNQAVQRLHVLEDNLKVFQHTFERTRNRILNVIGAMLVEMPSENTLTAEQENTKEQTVTSSEPRVLNTEDFRESRMHLHPQEVL